MHLFEMKRTRHEVAGKIEDLLRKSAKESRGLTEAELKELTPLRFKLAELDDEIGPIESKGTLRAQFPNGIIPGNGNAPRTASRRPALGQGRTPDAAVALNEEYLNDFYTWLGSRGQKISAGLYEGLNSAGGYAVPIVVEGQVVPLAPTDMGVREIAMVVPTSSDIKVPRATTISTASAKAEGTGSGVNVFTESEPVLDQFTLSAFMAGVEHLISWELAQDVPSFQSFAVGDMLLAQSIYEENLFVNGSGSGQAQGLIGNVGAGVTCATHAFSDILDSTFDIMGTLKTAYHQNASWLMSRATSVGLRKAQKQANLFEPVFVREGGRDYLHGHPVYYPTAMPAVAAAVTPILFGDFKQGYVIGDRGGSGINVKILDQPRAQEGLIVLLCYRRTDGRVRRSEAIQALQTT